jgi:hypothetical protein
MFYALYQNTFNRRRYRRPGLRPLMDRRFSEEEMAAVHQDHLRPVPHRAKDVRVCLHAPLANSFLL